MAWTLERQNSWPFNYTIKDEAGVEVVEQHVYAWSSDSETLEEVMDGKGFHGEDRKQAVEGNAAQLARFRLIAAAPELLEALTVTRMSAGWQHMSDETRALIEAAISKATS